MTRQIVVRKESEFGRIRIIIEEDGEIWFFASDVAKALGYSRPNDAVAEHCEEAKSLMISLYDNSPYSEIIDEYGNKFNHVGKPPKIIPESDVYNLVIGSRLKGAKRFKRWITKKVLPSIREKGYYAKDSLTELQILQQSVNALVRHEEELRKHESRLNDMDGRVSHIENIYDEVDHAIAESNLADGDPDPLSTRAKINMAVRSFCKKYGVQFDAVWNEIYRQVYYRHHIDLKARARNRNVSKLSIAEELDLIDPIWNILSYIIKEKKYKLQSKGKKDSTKFPPIRIKNNGVTETKDIVYEGDYDTLN